MQNQPLEVIAGEILRQRKQSLATAESCTGGLVGHRITNVPGSSDYYLGGVVAYANEAKMHLLGVKRETLERYGAVSRETVMEMAAGARQALSADIGLATSGIAGPSGGTPEKPVGLTWIGLSTAGYEDAWRYQWEGDRLAVKEQTTEQGLRLLVEYLEKPPSAGRGAAHAETSILVEVAARFDPQGLANPVSFVWQDTLYPIESIGRRWEEASSQHMLVMVRGGKVYKLVYAPSNRKWYLEKVGVDRSIA
jgi:nicotinamide-nucleotide amidase